MTRFWVGGYGADMEGSAQGIGLLAGSEGRVPTTLAYRGVAAEAESASWLAANPVVDVVYAALEGEGAVAAFARAGESALVPLGPRVHVGEAVCHLTVSPDGTSLVASCYGDGAVVRIALAADGRLIPPAADRQERAAALRETLFGTTEQDPQSAEAAPEATARVSRAHAAAFLPDGRVLTTDLGLDLLRIWRPAGAAGLRLDHEVSLPAGVGPRHLVVHPSGHVHVVTEYSCEVFTAAVSADGTWDIVAATAVSPVAVVGFDFPAELARSKDGATLYTALRGSNTLAALRVRGQGEIVEPLALADAGVDWPRHHLVYDGALLVSGQRSDDIAVVDTDERTGVPGRVRHRAPAPSPTHLLPVRGA